MIAHLYALGPRAARFVPGGRMLLLLSWLPWGAQTHPLPSTGGNRAPLTATVAVAGSGFAGRGHVVARLLDDSSPAAARSYPTPPVGVAEAAPTLISLSPNTGVAGSSFTLTTSSVLESTTAYLAVLIFDAE